MFLLIFCSTRKTKWLFLTSNSYAFFLLLHHTKEFVKSLDSNHRLSQINGSKKGTNLEKRKMGYLSANENIKANIRYTKFWSSILHGAEEDSQSHSEQLATMISKKKISGLDALDISIEPLNEKGKLSVPAEALVVTKFLKTFEMKLVEYKVRSRNASHSPDWISHVKDIHDDILDSEEDKEPYQFISTSCEYNPLTNDEIEYLNELTELNVGGEGIFVDS